MKNTMSESDIDLLDSLEFGNPIIYNPPYDSPIEDIFAYQYATKYAADDIQMAPQYRVKTALCGDFILDFILVTKKGYRVGIECDGKEYHDSYRDEWRDAIT